MYIVDNIAVIRKTNCICIGTEELDDLGVLAVSRFTTSQIFLF